MTAQALRTPENAFGAIPVISDEAVKKFRYYPFIVQDNGCWNYGGTIGNEGYGFVYTREPNGKKRTFLAHRVAYFIFNGAIPKGALICHACDNPKCVNPKHLFAGTNQENMDDLTRKGRRRMGSANAWSTLKEEQVFEIKKLIQEGELSNAEIGRKFGVGSTCISSIKTGKTWRHLA